MNAATFLDRMMMLLVLGTLWTGAEAARAVASDQSQEVFSYYGPGIVASDEERLEETSSHPPVTTLMGPDLRPPDARARQRETIFKPGLNVFLEEEPHSWACDRFNSSNASSKVKAILSSDLFSTGSDIICPTLARMLGVQVETKAGLFGNAKSAFIRSKKAFWINDARAGWDPLYVLDAWVRDGLWERKQFKKCGILSNAALWINRWDVPNSNMTLAKKLSRGTNRFLRSFSSPVYENTTKEEVMREIDEAEVLYMPGGNPYTLLRLAQDGPGKEILEYALARVKRGEMVYVSRSAGSIAAGVNINVSKDAKGQLTNMEGFDLFPEAKLALRPHYSEKEVSHGRKWRAKHDQIEWSQADMLDSLSDLHGHNGIALKDGEFVAIYGGNIALMPTSSRASKPLTENVEVVDADLMGKYTCTQSRGTSSSAYGFFGRSSFNGCGILCEEDPQCAAFDYTQNAKSGHVESSRNSARGWVHDACRLFKSNDLSDQGESGFQSRRHCAKKHAPTTTSASIVPSPSQ